jgi:hypothetical protein
MATDVVTGTEKECDYGCVNIGMDGARVCILTW